MMLIIAWQKDTAAVNIRNALVDRWKPEKIGNYDRLPLYRKREVTLASIDKFALEFDNPAREILQGQKPDIVVYLSKHKSKSGNRSLTVHPIGNYGTADFGGNDHTVVHTSPELMTAALRFLKNHEIPKYDVTFEVTHHGPMLDIPTFFIEIGSNLPEWNDRKAIGAVAETMMELIKYYRENYSVGREITRKNKVCIGLGGGHYAPRHTRFALKNEFDFGHMIPSYALKNLDREMAEQMAEKTPGVSTVLVHGKKKRKYADFFKELGLEILVD